MTVYRPSATIKLVVRTEEFEETASIEARLPDPFSPEDTLRPAAPAPASTGSTADTSAARLQANQERLAALERRRDSMPREEYDDERLHIVFERQDILEEQRQSEGEATEAPETISGPTTDDRTVIGQIQPRSMSIQRSGPNTADTATATISYHDMPIDPRIVRACGVEFIIGVVTPEDYESGMTGGVRADGSLLSVVNTTDDGTLLGATRFCGFVDKWSVDYDNDEGDTVTLECRDASAPLRDLKLPTGASIDMSRPIDEAIRSFLNAVSATTRGVNVIWSASGDPPTPSDSMPTRRRARRGRVQRRSRRGGEEMSIWDHITDVVRSQGFLPLVLDWDIIIIDPRTLYTSIGGTTMVFGRNLTKLSFSRDLQGVRVPTIEARCYDPERGRTLWARYPVGSGQRASGILGVDAQPRPSRANAVPPSGSNPDESIRVMLVTGFNDPSVLERVARGIYEEIGRQEIAGHFETDDAWSYYLEPSDADILELRAGDPVELLVSRASTEEDERVGSSTSLAELEAMERSRRAQYMESLGWSGDVARRFAALQDATGFETTFRTSAVAINFDNDQGLKVAVDFINYITIREEGSS